MEIKLSPNHNISILIMFDIDGTMIDYDGQPKRATVELFKMLQNLGCTCGVWSGGGEEYADSVAKFLGLSDYKVFKKGSVEPSIAFDDHQQVSYAVTIKID